MASTAQLHNFRMASYAAAGLKRGQSVAFNMNAWIARRVAAGKSVTTLAKLQHNPRPQPREI